MRGVRAPCPSGPREGPVRGRKDPMAGSKKNKKKTATRRSAAARKKQAPAKKKAAARAAKKRAAPRRTASRRAPAKRAGATEAAAGVPRMPLAVQKRRKQLTEILLRKRNQVVEGLEAQMGRKLVFDASQRIDSAMDSADQSAQDVDQGIDYSLIEMKYEQYKDIADAFRKLENNSYGLCEECGEEIDIKRLEVNPLARYCFDCKSRKEALEKIEREETRFKP